MKIKLFLAAILLAFSISGLKAQNSLWILDPNVNWNTQSGRINSALVSVKPKGLYMQYGLYLTFSATGTSFALNTNLEIVMNFTLPEGSIVYDSWLWVGDDIVQGKHIDRWSASNIYEGIVNRRRDPSLLVKNSPTEYQMRVYPMKKNETRKVKITYLVPATLTGDNIQAGLPAELILSSAVDPDLYVVTWEDDQFKNPEMNDPDIPFVKNYDTEFGYYFKARVPASKLDNKPVFNMSVETSNDCFVGIYRGQSENYYQLSVKPGSYIENADKANVLVLIDYEAFNSNLGRSQVLSQVKQQLLSQFGSGDRFNLMWSSLRTVRAAEDWMPVTPENVEAAFTKAGTSSFYSNLPGLLAEGMDFLNTHGSSGTIFLVSSSDNFANYNEANALIKDLKTIHDPLYPIHIADIQNQNVGSLYIGSQYYFGQEYLYVNLSKISGGYYQSIRQVTYSPALISEVANSLNGVITAFDMYSAPSEGFCYGRYNQESQSGITMNQLITQVGKFYGEPPFLVYLTGLYKSVPFSKLVTVEANQVVEGDSTIAKMWHGRYIQELEKTNQTTSISRQILFESLTNRVLSVYSAFLCLEPSDTVAVCKTCQDESRLTFREDWLMEDSTANLKLYPNPFTDHLKIEMAIPSGLDCEKAFVRFFNQTGQLVFEKQVSVTPGVPLEVEWKGINFEGSRVPAGTYFVMVQAGAGTWSKSVIKSE